MKIHFPFQQKLVEEVKRTLSKCSVTEDNLEVVIKYAMRCYASMPPDLQVVQPIEAWISEAMQMVLEVADEFNEKLSDRKYCWKFIRTRVWQRLKDRQREIFRMNPPSLHNIKRIEKELRRKLGRKPTVKEISEETGYEVDVVEKLLRRRPADVRMNGLPSSGDDGEEENPIESRMDARPDLEEQKILSKETFQIFWDCKREVLTPYEKLIVWMRRVQKVPLQELAWILDEKEGTLSPQITRAVNRIRRCMEDKYENREGA